VPRIHEIFDFSGDIGTRTATDLYTLDRGMSFKGGKKNTVANFESTSGLVNVDSKLPQLEARAKKNVNK
jgi:hypothetical protein